VIGIILLIAAVPGLREIWLEAFRALWEME
jgi:hypothetical protein